MIVDDRGDIDVSDVGDDRRPGWYRVHHDWDDGPISIAVVEAIGRATGVEPMDMTPLYHDVDPDALDQLLASAGENSPTTVRFSHNGCDVVVRASGEIEIRHTDIG